MFFLCPTKLLIVFATTSDAKNAVTVDSPLWNVFDDVRLWSEGESFDDRLVWIDCVGIHPLCWNKENLRIIGEKWGPVIQINSKVKGLENITSARILFRTKAQNRIDNRVKLFYENGSCDVWVKEFYGNCGEAVGKNEELTKPIPDHVDGKGEEAVDPLVQDMSLRKTCGENQGWVDPIVLYENIHWDNVVSADICNSCQFLSPPLSTPIMGNKTSRPRGRPRKTSNHQIPLENGMLEARKTWETAQLLGNSANDDEAVLSDLRKSKRIMIVEGNGG